MRAEKLLVMLGLLAIAGCAAAPGPKPVTFRCADGQVISVTFGNEVALVDTGDGATLTLPQERAASGISYRSATHALRGKGDEMSWTVGQMVPQPCTVVR
jgi:membrane-bound inhibitor of C-type lysozyme